MSTYLQIFDDGDEYYKDLDQDNPDHLPDYNEYEASNELPMILI